MQSFRQHKIGLRFLAAGSKVACTRPKLCVGSNLGVSKLGLPWNPQVRDREHRRGMPGGNSGPTPQRFIRCLRCFVPCSFIGAVIGARGDYIRSIQEETDASVRVEHQLFSHRVRNGACAADPVLENCEAESQLEPRDVTELSAQVADRAVKEGINAAAGVKPQRQNVRNHQQKDEVTRMVCINGSDAEIAHALFWVYQRVAEVKSVHLAEVRMHTEFKVPENMVGHIIGRSGVNIAELKRISMGCDVQVMSEEAVPEADVFMYGAFGPSATVFFRISNLRRMLISGEVNDNHNHRDGHRHSHHHQNHEQHRRHNQNRSPEAPSDPNGH